jgi:hypothetical protein
MSIPDCFPTNPAFPTAIRQIQKSATAPPSAAKQASVKKQWRSRFLLIVQTEEIQAMKNLLMAALILLINIAFVATGFAPPKATSVKAVHCCRVAG